MNGKMSRSIFLIFFLVPCSSLLIPGHAHRPSSPETHVALFIFGDSIFDAGNNNYINTTLRVNFWPYGETFFKYPTGRASNGRLIPDFIAEYAKLPLIPTFLPFYKDQFVYGVNFASSGAGALAETQRGYVIDLNTQLSYFKLVEKQLKQKLGDAGAKRLLSKAVYIFSIGTNDYLVPLFTNSSVLQSDYSRKKYIGMVIGNLTTTIKEIYEIGGRKFGFLNLDDLGCLPLIRAIVPGSSGSCLESVSELAKLHNKALSEVLPELESQLPGFKYAIHDFYNSSLEIINNPSRYGLKEAIVACCGSGRYRGTYSCGGMTGIKDYELCDNPEEYMFFDAIHPTEKTYKIIAELVWNGTPNITGPYNLKKLFEHL
ncbi:GDSL esterase/lipase 1-like [Pistacia vera]|uniref:GDSL esterase/lipase 1-like n=1 Tax=Pistacia vera TaxID=55513 RepID=UPI00126341CB|nr:GDSL esterase/lipase 1-like [Pistacia vera]